MDAPEGEQREIEGPPPTVESIEPEAEATRDTNGRPSRSRLLALIIVVTLVAGVAGGLVDRALVSGTRAKTSTITRSSSQIPGSGLDVAAIVSKAEPALVSISADSGEGFGATSTLGTGVILTSSGEVVTNSHIVHGASKITVTIAGQSHTARLLGDDVGADIALLKVDGIGGLAAAELGNASLVQVGDDVVVMGNALGLGGSPTVTKGIVSGTNRSFDLGIGTLSGLIQTDAGISSGDSGGALLNANGQVIGIVVGVASSGRTFAASDIGFAIAINDVLRVVDAIRRSAP
ncbi:MAG: S1C family serine protease [Actinomycetota bacterium]